MGTNSGDLRVLMITSEWPTPEHPEWVPFLVQQVKFLRKAGVSVDVFSFRGGKHPWNYWRARKQVQEKLAQNSYDLIHAQFGQSGLLVIPQSLPLTVTFHGSDVLGIVGNRGKYTLAGMALKKVCQIVANMADQAIAVSNHLTGHLPLRDFHILPLGIDLELFRPMPQAEARESLGISNQAIVVLFGANPSITNKRFWLAKEAVEQIRINFPDISLVALVGIEHKQVPLYMNASDVLLMTSLHEGSPTVVKEALACNLPVVSTDVGDVRERIGKIEGCVVCDDDRPETIAAALKQVLSRDARIEGRNAVLDLDENLLTKKLIAVYQEALNHA